MFDAAGFYQGPLPDSCGHTVANRHKKKTIGRNKAGGFNVSPTAAYPAGMCLFIATLIFDNFIKYVQKGAPFGMGKQRS